MSKSGIGKLGPKFISWSDNGNFAHHHLKRYETSLLGSLFIAKIVKMKPESVELEDWIDKMFGLEDRYIIQYEANRTFTLPGLFKPRPSIRLPGIIKGRVVKQGKRVWVRFDERLPNVIDFEAPIGHGEEVKIFQLTLDDWDGVRMWLLPVNEQDGKFHERHCKRDFGQKRLAHKGLGRTR